MPGKEGREQLKTSIVIICLSLLLQNNTFSHIRILSKAIIPCSINQTLSLQRTFTKNTSLVDRITRGYDAYCRSRRVDGPLPPHFSH